jgi:hypothetical protein
MNDDGRPPMGDATLMASRLLDRRACGLGAALVVAAVASHARVAPACDAGALAEASYVYVATVRKDGSQSAAVPVWFIPTAGDQILIDTNTNSRKARRIERGSPVLVWIGSRTGPAFVGRGELVADRAVQDEMIKQIPRKYWLAWLGLLGPTRAKFDAQKIVTIRLSPVRDLPPGFSSRPGAPAPSLEETAGEH